MATHSDIRDYAYPFFLEEAPELLQTIETGILKLRQMRDTATVYSIMRSAHSLKGGAASVGLEAIKTIAHRLETIFRALYSENLTIDSTLERQLLQAFDCLRLPLTDQFTQGHYDAEQALAAADPVLSLLEAHCQEAIASTKNFIPSSSELGINMVVSIFEIDVAQGLDRLTAVLENPQACEVAGELRAQAEVFAGFAELLNLSGFAKIAQTAIQAIDLHPDRGLDITKLALADFRIGRSAVLAGDLTQGGYPSAALLAFADRHAVPSPIELATADIDGAIEMMTPEELSTLLEQLGRDSENVNLLAELGLAELGLAELGLADQSSTPQIESEIESKFANHSFENLNQLDNQSDYAIDLPIAAENIAWIEAATKVTAEITTEPTTEDGVQTAAEITSESAAEITQTEQLTEQLEDVFGNLEIASSPSSQSFEMPSVDYSQAAHQSRANQSADSVPAQSEINLQPKLRDFSGDRAGRPNPASSTVRVDAERLARIGNLLGELTINRNGLALQNKQMRSIIQGLLKRFENFQAIVEQLRSLSDQMLIAPERRGKPLASSSPLANPLLERQATATLASALQQPSFDTLEMDSYTALYTHTQTLLEETMQLEETIGDISLFNRQSEQQLEQHRKMLAQVQDDLIGTRMLPLDDVFSRFPRILRDLSNAYGKPVNLSFSGSDLLVDKAVLEKLYDPLLHLLRNGFDHGIEPPDIRRAQGKPEAGQMTIQAAYKGNQIAIEVRDDGQGLDLDRIRQRVVDIGWLSETEAANVADSEICEFIFEPGFSTASQLSELSGRGMGLDAVRTQMQLLKGAIAIHSLPGQGTTFTLTLPLTLTIVNLLVCFVGSTSIALRSSSITEIIIPKPEQITQTATHRLIQWQGQNILAYRLSELLTYNCLVSEMSANQVSSAIPSPANWETPMLVFQGGQQPFALQVDRIVTEQDSVIKPFGTAIAAPSYTYGCTVASDGSLIPVIDGSALLEVLTRQGRVMSLGSADAAIEPAHSGQAQASPVQAIPKPPKQNQPAIRVTQSTTVLIVDDAITSRRMLAISLERVGYRVLQVRDGQEALDQLQRSQPVHLIICDVEMPNMNGFEFLTQRRQDPALANIPTVMLTSRSNDKHRWLAMQLGATAYFTKPYLEQKFLGAIASYIPAIR
jgi:two-component system, chemotaxis family, sensor histidine kinase and response regulator PixL